MRIFLIFLTTLMLATSCSSFRHLRNESEEWLMFGLLGNYTAVYAKPPESARDLLIFIDSTDTNTFDMNGGLYRFLKKNEHRLIFDVNDTTVTIYDQRVSPDRLVVRVTHGASSAYKNAQVGRMIFFNEQGYYVSSETLVESLLKRLQGIPQTHESDLKKEFNSMYKEMVYKRIMVEYTTDGLRDLSTGQPIDYGNSPYFSDVEKCLREFATENRLSKIIIRSVTDR